MVRFLLQKKLIDTWNEKAITERAEAVVPREGMFKAWLVADDLSDTFAVSALVF